MNTRKETNHRLTIFVLMHHCSMKLFRNNFRADLYNNQLFNE